MKTPWRLLFSFAAMAGLAAVSSGQLARDRESMRIIRTSEPAFPLTLIARGITEGYARVLINVDETGGLTDWLAVGYSESEFADSAIDALQDWRFVPMRWHGEAVPSQTELFLHFKATGVVISTDPSNYLAIQLRELVGRHAAVGPCPLAELDRPPIPTYTVKPAYPLELKDTGVQGSALIEFIVDETGAVRMPAVISTDFQELGYLAVEAVRQWKFDPPTSNGRPVLVRVQQEFQFADANG